MAQGDFNVGAARLHRANPSVCLTPTKNFWAN